MPDDTDLKTAVDQFLDSADSALAEYDQGYADADATLALVRSHLADLREVAED